MVGPVQFENIGWCTDPYCLMSQGKKKKVPVSNNLYGLISVFGWLVYTVGIYRPDQCLKSCPAWKIPIGICQSCVSTIHDDSNIVAWTLHQ